MPTDMREREIPRYIEDEMKDSYIDYSMSVIVGRALPDVRDGLKPAHRRILHAMNDIGLLPNRPYKKSASVVGDVLARFHPHGDAAVYETLVRMAQDFSLRYPLIDGQGNFGSIDGDQAAAYRYTEARLKPLAVEMLADIDKDTVNFGPNFDNSIQEPLVLPSRVPNLLVNGSSGIAVGMATNIPPHNLPEVIDCAIRLIEEPEVSDEDLYSLIQGPDFPGGAYLCGREGILDYYRTGRGRLILRAKVIRETKKDGRESLVITEIPYQVNKARLVEQIAELVKKKEVEGISDLRDESDREGMRVVIELKRHCDSDALLNTLYKKTQMQVTFGVILLALLDGVPEILNLRQILEAFLKHRHAVIQRRTAFELDKAEKRAHILEGLKVAVENIDEIVQIIKGSRDVQIAKETLMARFGLSDEQTQAILDMRLARLTGLERNKVDEEYKELLKTIARLRGILESRRNRMEVVKQELNEGKEKYGDPRRTEIIERVEDIDLEDIVSEEDMVIILTHRGYIKRISTRTYRQQRRGGKGIIGMATGEGDFVEHMFIASTKEYILFFTKQGICHWLKVYGVPEGGREAKGRPVVNLLNLREGDEVAAYVPVRHFEDGKFLLMATRNGIMKKTKLSGFANPRQGGIIAAGLEEGDELIDAAVTDGQRNVILATRNGHAIRFREENVREMGRTAVGVHGIKLRKGDRVVGMIVEGRTGTLLVATEKGYGKRSEFGAYRLTRRGGLGVITLKVTEKTGHLVAIKEVLEGDNLMLVSVQGTVIRMGAQGIRVMGRSTQGVKLMNLNEGDLLADVACLFEEKVEGGTEEETV
ncbi:MAG: DNA gyrase subunit A [Candidatus Glassbacteria bacterium RBG_16_58_8]|uniref:DNA gyrase subunit A n=1 Tax=Candidatus Glassbacteria bacterium RBG_16_58_8 TaxID=1817866 RepID=A0A1F5YCY1_9BACT|nr:MAG: DNA gyrase subunit A [Candidatus Glassbacteria bacterium RBG_16_58_8]